MTRWFPIAPAILTGLIVAADPAIASGATQQEKPAPQADVKSGAKQEPAAEKDRVDGTVESIDKKKNVLTLRARTDGNLRQVIVSDQTVYSVQNKPGSLDDLQPGRRVICVGQLKTKGQLAATRCDVREPK